MTSKIVFHRNGQTAILLLVAGMVLLFAANLFVGSVAIPFEEVCHILLGKTAVKEGWQYIVLENRLPQAITALLCGASLATAGLLLQTTFNNPLAGPSILGISSGASLGVAIVMLSGGSMLVGTMFQVSGFFAVLTGAFVGALFSMGLLLLFSSRVKNNLMLLIIGMMLGYLTSSIITLLNVGASSEGIHAYTVWGMGDFGSVSMKQLPFFSITCIVGLLLAIFLMKPLNALLLGTRYAENLGINIIKVRNWLLLATGILTAVTTAFCGPVAFIGLAVPHMARLLLGTSNHRILLPVTMLVGACIALLCNIVCILPGDAGIIPLNAVTPIIGAPIIIYIIINQRHIQYFN